MLLKNIFRFWWATYKLVTEPAFEEATFQAHLAIGSKLLSMLASSSSDEQGAINVSPEQLDIVNLISQQLQQRFATGFELTTGLSMEVLWKYFRPTAIPDLQTIQNLTELENLAIRFDALRWKVSITARELEAIMSSLIKAYKMILTLDVDGESLIEALNVELTKLEAETSDASTEISPFLATQFEALRHFKIIDTMRRREHQSADEQQDADHEIAVLASHSTVSLMHLVLASKTSQLLQNIDYLWGDGKCLIPVQDSFSISLLSRLSQSSDVDLKSLKLWEFELPALGHKIVNISQLLCRDQVLDLNDVLYELTLSVVEAHNVGISDQLRQWFGSLSTEKMSAVQLIDLSVDDATLQGIQAKVAVELPHLGKILEENIKPVLVAIAASQVQVENRLKFSALAWIHFAVAFILLYVPDRSFDPDKRQRLERYRHEETARSITDKIEALRDFEKIFSGQNSNLRCQLLEEELRSLGNAPEALQEIYRPDASELEQLQGEFNNLLNTVLQSKPIESAISYVTSADESASLSLQLLQRNLVQIVRRLSERFRGYSDMTTPVIGMLRCLQIGISMAGMTLPSKNSNTESIQVLSRLTPFLGGSSLTNAEKTEDQSLDYLEILATISNVEDISSFDLTRRRVLLDSFHACYEQWSKRLEEDRTEAEAKAGLYRFKGSSEDEEEENQEQFNELFPSYEEDNPTPASGAHPVRNTAVILSELHERIVSSNMTSEDSIMLLLKHMAGRIAALHDDDTNYSRSNLTGALLPGALVLINERIEALQPGAKAANSYNFYTDANLTESRQLVHLVHQIQNRFRELQGIDEIAHMQPLEDVIVSCRELLEFRHTEPLAKVITKVEKVHGYMHEWQFGGWASRANSAVNLYDSLTQTIVNWRRLELSTWARLFDMENVACEENAKSWWFIAYQVVVAAPLGVSTSDSEVRTYVQKLLQDLESYFSTAIQGQFKPRLQLLKQLQTHLDILAIEVSSMSIVSTAVKNFIRFYTRYEKPVTDNLQKGRAALEKAMKDVLLLASWKDTNIVALRDSARRSHHKLFKLIRKYRALLGQPMDLLIKQGLPDEKDVDNTVIRAHSTSTLPMVNRAAFALCDSNVPGWKNKSKRLVNVSKTISIMDDTSRIPESAVDGSQYLESFLSNIMESTAELQKATPSVLTEDNKVEVKHLKTRKRKLFADTIKDLRQMGIKANLGTNVLAKQESLSVVLASTNYLPANDVHDLAGLEYYFHKSLDLLPRVREGARQHNEDLSGAEAARSCGLLEGLLQVALNQRTTLATAIVSYDTLITSVEKARRLWSPEEYSIKNSGTTSTYPTTLKWIPNILRVGSDLVKIHSKFGKRQMQDVLDTLSLSIDVFEELARQYQGLPTLPDGIESTNSAVLARNMNDAVNKLTDDLTLMINKHPDLDYILRQIPLWTTVTLGEAVGTKNDASISVLDSHLSQVSDAILVAIEKLANSIQHLPNSTDDPLWFVKYDQGLASSISSLHVKDIISLIQKAFGILSELDLEDETKAQVAAATFAVALPLFQQYSRILEGFISRYAGLHRVTCKMTYVLASSFIQISAQGFCTPAEKSNDQDGQTENLESGTGLGDGEGAEDISKDIQDDEDLSELAQEPNKEDKDGIENEDDAVDMGDGEMEGEMGEAEEKGEDEEGSGDDEEEGDDIDEEAGDVDDLDPNAVDEKMWDGDDDKAEKDQEGDDSKGKADKNEHAAAQEDGKQGEEGEENKQGEEEEEEEEMAGAEQSEEIKQDEAEKHDPHAEEGEALELPDEMELDGDGNEKEESVSGSDDGMDDLSDVDDEDHEDTEQQRDEAAEDDPSGHDAEGQEDQGMSSDLDVIDPDQENDEGEGEDTEEAGEKAKDEEPEQDTENEENLLKDQNDDGANNAENPVPSDAQGAGEGQDDEEQNTDTISNAQAKREEGSKGGESSEQQDAAADEGENSRQADGDAPQEQKDDTQTGAEAQPFKKLGDALEKWHRQQNSIRDAPEKQEDQKDQQMDISGKETEFQHLQDENAEADAQALGTASEDQAHALDESMAVDPESNEMPEIFQPDELEQDDAQDQDAMDAEEDTEQADQEQSDANEGRTGAMIKQATVRVEDFDQADERGQQIQDLESDIEEVDDQLATTHIDDPALLSLSRSAADARSLWSHYESLTRDLSLSLTEQLRLILAPTLATKMRGDFRTGKRLNIKRIIPYIASQYKRDKIWMRRSVPSKRNYQIMLAVDDSKSMGETGSGSLAFETLVMVSKSLSMLEVGEICVVGFGQDVHVAHDFDAPFSSDAGPKIFQNFAFDQSRTDVTKLVRESIDLFRNARRKASSSPADLWQLQLIISDGVCNSSEHEPIRRLLREAMEERIMMVFIIVDDVKSKKKGESVMDLKEAKFVKDEVSGVSGVKIERYLDTFPFQYYLVVSDVRELPGVLATLLRQWFAEVVDSSA